LKVYSISPTAASAFSTSTVEAGFVIRTSRHIPYWGHMQERFRLSYTILPGILQGILPEKTMSDTAQKRALRNYRSRLTKRGLARFEVLGLDADRDLIRSVARRLAEDGPDSARIRAAIGRTISGDSPKRGGILDALRRSPLVGADLDFERSRESGRKVDL
jgi:hypothetical protein